MHDWMRAHLPVCLDSRRLGFVVAFADRMRSCSPCAETSWDSEDARSWFASVDGVVPERLAGVQKRTVDMSDTTVTRQAIVLTRALGITHSVSDYTILAGVHLKATTILGLRRYQG